MTGPSVVTVDGSPLSVAEVVAVARGVARVAIDPGLSDRMAPARSVVDRIVAEGATVYGITTGFGALASVRVSPAEARQLQQSLVLSHAAGMGPPVEPEVVRAMMLLRARTLAAGVSGVRPVLVAGSRRPSSGPRHAPRPRARKPRSVGRPRPSGPRRGGALW